MHKGIKSLCYVLNIVLLCTISLCIAAKYNPKNEKVIICGVGKNIASCLSNMINKIESLGNCFKDYRVIIYENNSTDSTVAILQNWARNNRKVIVFSENLTSEQLHHRTKAHALRDKAPCRMELIAYARNIVLKRALQDDLADFKFLIMTDMDFARGWEVQGVLSSLYVDAEWDGLVANSMSGNGGDYYDRYAYRDENNPFGPELLGEYFWQELGKNPIRIHPHAGLLKIYSGFGGVAVYKKSALLKSEYAGYVTPEFERFMSLILNYKVNRSISPYKYYTQNIQSNPSIPVLFSANSGYDGPVVCEHSILHASMILNGFDKIYVNPAMVCFY